MTNVVYAQPYRNELGSKLHAPTDETKRFVSNVGWLVNYLNCCFCCKSQALSTPNIDKVSACTNRGLVPEKARLLMNLAS